MRCSLSQTLYLWNSRKLSNSLEKQTQLQHRIAIEMGSRAAIEIAEESCQEVGEK
jgi:hypothetical protein